MNYIDTGLNERTLEGDKRNAIETYKNRVAILTDAEKGIRGVQIIGHCSKDSYSVVFMKKMIVGQRVSGPLGVLKYNNLEQLYVAEEPDKEN